MFGAGRDDPILRRGIFEALACRDMLERMPVKRPLLARAVEWLDTTVRALAYRDEAHGRRVTTPARSSVP